MTDSRSPDPALLTLDRVSFSYRADKPLIANLSWQIAPGSTWAVLGPSGSGKTTLLYLLAGLRLPTAGMVCFRGQPLDRTPPEVGLMLQNYGLLPWFTARENIEIGLRIRGVPREVRRNRTRAWLQRLQIDDVARQYPGQLSGGQGQRVGLARLLALETSVLLLDEPFSAVDELTRERLQRLLRQLRQDLGATLVLVTHSIEEAALLADNVLLITQDNPIRDPQVFVSPFAGGAAPSRDDPQFTRFCSALRKVLQR